MNQPIPGEHGNDEGRRYWRSLDEFHGDPQWEALIDEEFGNAAPPPTDGLSRRKWLQLMGASLAFGATMTGCRYPAQKIAPFAFRPHGRTPGIPESYSTMLEFGGIARPLVATVYDGRPIKLDGNPDHPDTRGASDVFTQATILELYDPDRSRASARAGENGQEEVTWEEGAEALKALANGDGMAVLAEPCSSPTLRRLREKLLEQNASARWYEFTSITTDHSRTGVRMAVGDAGRPVYHLENAKVILAVDADPLGLDPAMIRLSRDFAASRDADNGRMSRLYSVESDFTTTGAMADHRLALRFTQVGPFLAALEAALDGNPGEVDKTLPETERFLAAVASDLAANRGTSVVMVGPWQPADVHARAMRINSRLNNIGSTVTFVPTVEARDEPGVDQLGELISAIRSGEVKTLLVLGGNPVFYAPSDLEFADALGAVPQSFHVGIYRDETSNLCNWHLNAAHPLECWGDGTSVNGSTLIAQPLIDPLFGGWSAIELLAVLTGEAESSGALSGQAEADSNTAETSEAPATPGREFEDAARQSHKGHMHYVGMAAVQQTHLASLGGGRPENAWRKVLRDGFIEGSALSGGTEGDVSIREMSLPADDGSWKTSWTGGDAELIFRPSKSIYDGRYANNGWLQELPELLTKLTWDNAALVSPTTADTLELTHGKIVNLKVGEQTISLPVYVMPGLAAGTICTWLGYGREAGGRVAGHADYLIESVGHDIRPLRTSGNWWSVPAVTALPTSTRFKLATTQDHFRIDDLGREEINKRMGKGSGLIREGTWASYEEFQREHGDGQQPSDAAAHVGQEYADGDRHSDDHHGWPTGHHLHFENFDLTRAGWKDDPAPYKWGMGIDLNKCTGCNACVIACQAENNIPVVGKEQVTRGREMQWMRIDRYFITGPDDDEGRHPQIATQPVTCQHCENAPCETVCPVAATTHSDEGLNDMVYNRCIGTRYCGNNCPYKVRRFNYFNFSDAQTFIKLPGADRLKPADHQLLGMVMNPEVTIRSRGVMEKCTYCVQRIQNKKILAKTENNRKLRADEIRTACQDACPTGAITFGDIQNPASEVHKAHHNPRAYALLEGLNVGPRTRYLARVRNPHPELGESGESRVESGESRVSERTLNTEH